MDKFDKKSELHKLTNHVLKVRDFVFDLIFPIDCISCEQEGSWLCHDCFKKLEFSREQYCLNCKTANKLGEFCYNCQKEYYLDGVIIAGNYDDKILNQLIKLLKYYFIKNIAIILGGYLINFLQSNPYIKLNPKSIIIPVPLHQRRWRWRGFNQAEEIAKIVAQNLQLRIYTKNLIRTKHKKAQAKLNEKQRLENVKDCYAWSGNNLTGADIILIDDIATTGATLNECAKILKQNGAGKVWGLVVAKG